MHMSFWSFPLKTGSEISASIGSLIAKQFIQGQFRTLFTFIIASTLMMVPGIAKSAPLSEQQVSLLVRQCASSSDPSVLRSVAHVESHFDPLALHNDTKHISVAALSLAASAEKAKQWISQGYSVDIGLMQINSGNLSAMGMTVEDALDPCRSLAAGSRILQSAFAVGSSESERQAAILISLSRYNTGRALAGIANGYANQVIRAQSASLDDKQAQRNTRNTSPQWEIWGTSRAESVSWVVTADGSSEIVRAGAQSSDARNEGRAPASRSEKGEPYELFAYQESKTPKP